MKTTNCDICGVEVEGKPSPTNDPRDHIPAICEDCDFKENFDPSLLTKIELKDVDVNDYPIFMGAYVYSAWYKDFKLNDNQLQWLSEEQASWISMWVKESLN